MKKGKFTKWIIKFDIEKILNLEKEGYNAKEIAAILEIPSRRFCEMLKSNNILLQSKRQTIKKNHIFFQKIDSEIKAYLLGYTIADGCVSIEPKKRNGIIYCYSKRLSYTVSVDDREVIDMLQLNISPTSTIKEFHNSKGALLRKRQLSLRFSSSTLVDDLIKLNVIPNKTYDSNFEFDFDKIPKELHRHLIRGFFDGDGSYKKNSLQFISTSLLFLKQIISFFENEIPCIKHKITECKGITINYYRLHFRGLCANKQVYDLFYKDANYYLSRKKNKFNIENTVLNKETKKSLSV